MPALGLSFIASPVLRYTTVAFDAAIAVAIKYYRVWFHLAFQTQSQGPSWRFGAEADPLASPLATPCLASLHVSRTKQGLPHLRGPAPHHRCHLPPEHLSVDPAGHGAGGQRAFICGYRKLKAIRQRVSGLLHPTNPWAWPARPCNPRV